jgi:hypothetical protein
MATTPMPAVVSRRIRNIGVAAALVISACADQGDGNGSAGPEPVVVLSIAMGPGPAVDPIPGGLRCESEIDILCVADSIRLAEAVLHCGPVEATIYRANHVHFVSFPSGLDRRFPQGMPSDLDIVRCVQSRVGFGFSAGIHRDPDPDGWLDADPRPFEALHRDAR